jgi:hypothetical protein
MPMLSLHKLFFNNFIDDRSNTKTPKTKKTQPMKTDQQDQSATVFLQIVAGAVAQLKQRLQQHYEQAYPDLREVIHLVLDEEEANARELSLFPHLLLPDLVEAHISNLNLYPVETKHDDVFASQVFNGIETRQSAFALCG